MKKEFDLDEYKRKEAERDKRRHEREQFHEAKLKYGCLPFIIVIALLLISLIAKCCGVDFEFHAPHYF